MIAALIPTWLQEFEKEAGYMPVTQQEEIRGGVMMNLECPICGAKSQTTSVICPKHIILYYDKDGKLDIKETRLREIRERSHTRFGEAWQYLADH